jgi:hypothetical protein
MVAGAASGPAVLGWTSPAQPDAHCAALAGGSGRQPSGTQCMSCPTAQVLAPQARAVSSAGTTQPSMYGPQDLSGAISSSFAAGQEARGSAGQAGLESVRAVRVLLMRARPCSWKRWPGDFPAQRSQQHLRAHQLIAKQHIAKQHIAKQHIAKQHIAKQHIAKQPINSVPACMPPACLTASQPPS